MVEKAAAKDDAGAMTKLGALYENGHGVAQDYGKAREWYEKAAAKDDAAAMNNLGALYENGLGVAQDYGKAREWYEKAADKGEANAKTRLENLLISQAAGAGRYAEALQRQEAFATKLEAEETKRDGKPGEQTLRDQPSDTVRRVRKRILESVDCCRSLPRSFPGQPRDRNQPGARTHVHGAR